MSRANLAVTACNFMSLQDQIRAKKQAELEHSIETVLRPGEAAFIEFFTDPHNCVAYAPSQLMHYHLQTHKPDLADDPTRPSQTLTLGFPTGDLIITGNRLQLITAALKQGILDTVRVISPRYAELDPRHPFVAKIEIRTIPSSTH